MRTSAEVVAAYWATAQGRDWVAFGALLADDIVYDLSQTRELIRGRDKYVRFNQEFPGDWALTIIRLVATGAHVATWTSFTVDGTEAPGLCFFDLDSAGRIAHITDFWPERYEPPTWRKHLVERY
jgi:predicted ester cyclase